MKVCGIILAGGRGTRLWPLSTQKKPKQFLKIFNDKSLIELTVQRLNKIIDLNDIYVVTTKSQYQLMRKELNHLISKSNIIVEPEGKNTAPCICYASMILKEKYGDCITAIFPSDAYIFNESEFIETINNAITISEKNELLVTIGITPSFPTTSYGYINYNPNTLNKNYYPVVSFTEKPCLEVAKEYLDAGTFLWNSGIFIWKTSTILNEFKKYLPNTINTIAYIINNSLSKKEVKYVYSELIDISIDYGILEHSKIISVIPGNFGWSDVGCFDLLKDCLPSDSNNNTSIGNQHIFECNNFFSIAPNKTVVGINVKNIILVENENTILICQSGKSTKVGEIMKKIIKDKDRKE